MNAVVDISGVRLETERLILRSWREPDLEDFFAYASMEGVGEMAGWQHHPDLEMSRRVLSAFINEKKCLALELKKTGKVIGSLGIEELNPLEFDDPALLGRELGYVLSKDHWGRGLMPEAVNAVIEYCFDRLGLDFLTCAHFMRNQQSKRVIEKSGFCFLKEISYKTYSGDTEPSRLYVLYNPKIKR